MRRLAASLLLALAIAGCGPLTSGSRASPKPASGAGSAAPTPTFFKPRPSAPTGGGSGPLAVMLAAAQGGAPVWTIALVGTDGKTVAGAQTSAPPRITSGGGGGGALATPLPLVSASSTTLYYLDGANVMALRRDGSTARVTTLPSGPNLHVGFAVSPDDKQIAYSVLDYAQQPVVEGLFIDPIPAAGGHGALFNSTGPDYGWPVGWHGHQLVMAHGPAFVQTTAFNPYSAFNGYRVVDPLTADRLAPPLQFNDCQLSGPLTAAGSACFNATETRIVNYEALSNPRAAPVAWAAVSPDGSRVAACCGNGGRYETLGYPGAAGDIPILPASQYGGGWLDATHFLADGDLTTPAKIWDSTSNQVVSATGVLGHFAAVVPGGLGDSSWGGDDPIGAVRALLEGPSSCLPKAGPPPYSRSFGCPVTDRLQVRLQTANVNANPACRCQNAAPLSYKSDALVPTAHVTATMAFSAPLSITWGVNLEAGRWFADDSWCAGSAPAETSIYKDPLGPCKSG